VAESHGDAKGTTAHTEANAEKHEFPPFQKDTFASQLVSLVIAFVALYLIVSRIALPRVGEVIDGALQEVDGGDEVGVEDGDVLALGHLQALIQCACLEAVTIGAMEVDDIVPERGITRDDARGNFLRLVCRVVENLDLELLARVLDGADGFDEPVDDELLVENGKLYSDSG